MSECCCAKHTWSQCRCLQCQIHGSPAPAARLGASPATWHRVALALGEHLAPCGPNGYYEFSPEEWYAWAIKALTPPEHDLVNYPHMEREP